jgi:hypothetical protein
MVSKVDHTVDYAFKSWPYCRLSIFQKKIATVATSRLSIFCGFCCGFFIRFQWECGRIRTKWPQNLQKSPTKSTVDYVADPRSCNSWLFSRKLTILSTMVSKVDHTVDYGFKSWPYCRLRFQKLTILSTSQKKLQRLSTSQKKICNSRFIVKSRLSTLKQCLEYTRMVGLTTLLEKETLLKMGGLRC